MIANWFERKHTYIVIAQKMVCPHIIQHEKCLISTIAYRKSRIIPYACSSAHTVPNPFCTHECAATQRLNICEYHYQYFKKKIKGPKFEHFIVLKRFLFRECIVINFFSSELPNFLPEMPNCLHY